MIKKLILTVAMTLPMIASAAAETVLRFAEGSPNRGTRADAIEYFFKDAKKLSEGELGFDMHWGGALFDYRTTIDGVTNGAVDMGSILGAYDPSKLRALTIGDLPSKFADPWVGMRAMYELMTTNEALQQSLAKQNLVYITGYSTTGIQFECGGNSVIRTVADIKGKRMRAVGNYANILSDLGANMVSVTAGEFYQALDTGLVDCSGGYLYAMRSLKTYEVINNVTLANWGQVTGYGMLINLDSWNDLSPKQQHALREAGSNMIDYFGQLQIEEMDQVVEGLRTGSIGRKVNVHEMAEEERDKLLQAGEKYAHNWVDAANKDGLNGAQIWSDYQDLMKKYEQERDTKGYPWAR